MTRPLPWPTVGGRGGTDGYVRLAVDAHLGGAGRRLRGGPARPRRLWADDDIMRLALGDSERGLRAIVSVETEAAAIPRSPPVTCRRFGWSAPCATSTACSRSACPIPGRGSITAAGPGGERAALRIPAGRGRGAAPDPCRASPRRHYRTGPFPLHRQRRNRGPARGAAGLRAQGRRGPVHRCRIGRVRVVGRMSGDSTVAYAWAYARAVESALRGRRRRAPCCCAASWPSWSARRTTSASRRDLQRRQLIASSPMRPAAGRRAGRWPRPASAIA